MRHTSNFHWLGSLSLLLFLLTSCQLSTYRNSRTLPEKTLNPSAFSLFTPKKPKIILELFPIAQTHIVFLNAEKMHSLDYFQFNLCSLDSKNQECQTGSFHWQGKAFIGLQTGKYKVELRACANNFSAPQEKMHSCSKPRTEHFKIDKALDKHALAIIEHMKNAGDKITTTAYQIHSLIKEFLLKNNLDDNLEMQTTLTNLLLMGPEAFAAVVNSDEFEWVSYKLGVNSDAEYERDLENINESIDEKIKELSEEIKEEESQAFKKWASVLFTFGSAVALTGVVLAGVSYSQYAATKSVINTANADSLKDQAKEITETTSWIVRNLFHLPQGYVTAISKSDLENRLLFENSKIPEQQDQYKKIEINNQVLWKKNDSIHYLVDGDAVYKMDSTLISAGEDLNHINEITFSEWEKLPLSIKSDFIKKGENFVLHPYVVGEYTSIEGKIYKKSFPEYEDRFPDLNENTITRLYNRKKNLLTSSNESKAEIERIWAKGVPLIDKENRLVEPPDSWKVAGSNWFSDSSMQKVSQLEFAGLTFKLEDINNPKEVVKLPRAEIPEEAKENFYKKIKAQFSNYASDFTWDRLSLTETLWKIEISLKYNEYDFIHKQRALHQEAVQTQDITKAKIRKRSLRMAYASGGLFIFGAAVATTAIALGLANAKISKFERQIGKLMQSVRKNQLQRIKAYKQLMEYFKERKLPFPAHYKWIYLL